MLGLTYRHAVRVVEPVVVPGRHEDVHRVPHDGQVHRPRALPHQPAQLGVVKPNVIHA